ncbi:hypothetical protein [Actinomycetospora callitridis]|uniref:hypothetical protein n=1 Tax=Actinomycetospora callitridis TaxID=913944 RepID=UPI002365F1E1|nr:hypothetical protein [Actinomycetospora callitridis]MDD7921928.1 hypothetical protein [Actinomycetospora callitridis]
MLKKMGVVTVGVAAGLMVAAPFASAHESGHDSGHDSGHRSHHGSDSSDCNVTGGSSEANGGIDGDSFLGNAVVQAPVGGANVLNVVCNDILNGNLSGNDVAVSVLGEEAEVPTPDAEAPEAPEAPVDPVIFDVL